MEIDISISVSIFKLKTMRLFLFLFALIFIFPASAQNKEISQARSYIKSRSNLDKAEASMRDLLKDSANRRNMKIWLTLSNAMHAQYEVANEKLYLKEKLDTASLFSIVRRMFLVDESLDSLDAEPNKNDKVNIKYRKKNSSYLDKYRQNLYYGGLFFIRNQDYLSAYDLLDTYLDCRYQPLFEDFDYKKTDDTLRCSSAAFWSVYSGYKLNRLDSALKYSDIAVTNEKFKIKTLQYMAEIYLLKKDTANYVNTLHKGFLEDKTSEFFFTRLLDYYNNENLQDSAMYIVDLALSVDGNKELFLFAKSNVLLNLGNYFECISICDTLLARDSVLPEVYYNAGVSYINLALLLEGKDTVKKKSEKKVLEYYRKSLPYMEKYRELMPEDKEKWAPFLYNVYLKLNMGHQFEEISDILLKIRQ